MTTLPPATVLARVLAAADSWLGQNVAADDPDRPAFDALVVDIRKAINGAACVPVLTFGNGCDGDSFAYAMRGLVGCMVTITTPGTAVLSGIVSAVDRDKGITLHGGYSVAWEDVAGVEYT